MASAVRRSVFYLYAERNIGAPQSCRWRDKEQRVEVSFPHGVTVSEGLRAPGKLETHGKLGDSIDGLTVEEARAIDLLEKSSVDWFGSASEDRDWTDHQHLFEHDGCIAVASFVPGKDGRVVSVRFEGDDMPACWPSRYRAGGRAAKSAHDCTSPINDALYAYATGTFGMPMACRTLGEDGGIHTERAFAGGVSLSDERTPPLDSVTTTLTGLSIAKEQAVPLVRSLCATCAWDKPRRLADRSRPGVEHVSFGSEQPGAAAVGVEMVVKNDRVIAISWTTGN
jgi:hypothetical protein